MRATMETQFSLHDVYSYAVMRMPLTSVSEARLVTCVWRALGSPQGGFNAKHLGRRQAWAEGGEIWLLVDRWAVDLPDGCPLPENNDWCKWEAEQ